MLSLLAQSSSPDGTIFDTINSVFSRFDALAHPDKLVRVLQDMSVVWAVVFIIAGAVCLLNGYKLYRWVTIVLAACIGVFVGYALGKRINAEFIVAASFGALLAVCAWPLMKYAVAVLGGIVGAFLGANIWGACAGLAEQNQQNFVTGTAWVGALIGLIVCGMLAFILFKFSVLLFTSVSGSTIAMIGVLALVLQVPPWRTSIDSWSGRANAIVFPLLMIVPAVIGLILQNFKPEAGGGAAPATGGKSAK